MNAFSWVFLAALAAATLTRWWLARRQIEHVRANRDAVPPMFADVIPLDAHQKAADYTVAKARLGTLDLFMDGIVILAFTLGGGLDLLSSAWARAFEPGSLAHGTALLFSLFLVQAIIGLPFSIYRIFSLEERFGFNRTTWKVYAADLVKQTLLAVALGVPIILALLWLMQHMGAWWWLYAWLVLTAFSIVLQLLFPAVILPLFNKFTPLAEGELSRRVARLLERCGFKSKGLFVMDGSKRSSHGNAFFAGFGAAKRIVLFDTLVDRLDPPEVEAVLAHELGHYKLHHILKRIVLSTLTTLAGLWVLGLVMHETWFFAGLGVSQQGMAAALALFLLVVPQFTYFLHPVSSHFSRKHEFEADAYATSHADAAQLAQALVKLYRDNASTLTPDPLHSAFYDSHPPAAVRIARLRTT